MPQRDPGIARPETGCPIRVMQLTFGRNVSWLDDHTAAENITSAKASSKQARMAADAFERASQFSATLT